MFLLGDSCETGDFDTNIDWALCALLHCILSSGFIFSFRSILFLLRGCVLKKGIILSFILTEREKKKTGINEVLYIGKN